jgi:hypothetical protein
MNQVPAGFVLLQDRDDNGEAMFAGPAVVEGVRARAENAGVVDNDPVLFGIAILHNGPNFSVRLLYEGYGEGVVTKPLDGPIMAVYRDLPKG